MRHLPDMFANGMPDGFMRSVDALACLGVIGMDRCIFVGVFFDEILKRFRIGFRDHFSANLIRPPILACRPRRSCRPHHGPSIACARRCSCCGASRRSRFRQLDGTVEHNVVTRCPGFPNPVQHEPCGLLLHAKVTRQFHGRNRLEAGQTQIDGNRPFPQRNPGRLHRRVGPCRKAGTASVAPVGHFPVTGLTGVQRTAFRTTTAIRPDDGLEPFPGRVFSRKHVHQPNDGKAVSAGFSGHFSHFPHPSTNKGRPDVVVKLQG